MAFRATTGEVAIADFQYNCTLRDYALSVLPTPNCQAVDWAFIAQSTQLNRVDSALFIYKNEHALLAIISTYYFGNKN